VIKEQIAVK